MDVAPCRYDQSENCSHPRGLPCSVGAENAYEGAAFNRDIDVGYDDPVAQRDRHIVE